MKTAFINSIQTGDAQNLKVISKLISIAVRDGIEDFHVKYLNDEQMAELNPLICDAIYNLLFAISGSESNINCARYVQYNAIRIPDYRYEPELEKDFQDLLQVSSEVQSIHFNSLFLNEQFNIGNIIHNQSTGCVEIIPSYEFKGISGNPKSHGAKISNLLKKEGYRYHYTLMGYYISLNM